MILAEKRRDKNVLITKRIDHLSSTPGAPAAAAPGELFIAETTAEVLATMLSVRGTVQPVVGKIILEMIQHQILSHFRAKVIGGK